MTSRLVPQGPVWRVVLRTISYHTNIKGLHDGFVDQHLLV